MLRILVSAATVLLCLAASSAALPEARAERSIPVVVTAKVEPAAVGAGVSIPLAITIANGLPSPIHHTGSWVEPTEWNGETFSISLVDVYRNGTPSNLFLHRPDLDLPDDVAGVGHVAIEPGESLSVRTDARKWTLRDGWLPGRYEITVRVDGLRVDRHCVLSVTSDPTEFEILDTRGASGADAPASDLPADFVERFDRMFLSSEPLRYQDNVALLNSIDAERLSVPERETVRLRLRSFLSAGNVGRDYADDCVQTGVADPFAFLRLGSVQILARVGTREDVEFIRGLDTRRETEHPLFEEECARAIAELEKG